MADSVVVQAYRFAVNPSPSVELLDRVDAMCRLRVLARFGRADAVDREALRWLVRSISRFLDPLTR